MVCGAERDLEGRTNHVAILLVGAAFRSLLVVRRNLGLGIDALNQRRQKRVVVDNGGGDAVDAAFVQPNQSGHHGDVPNGKLQKQERGQSGVEVGMVRYHVGFQFVT